MEWISEKRRNLNEQLLKALVRLGKYQFEQHAYESALDHFRQAAELHTLHEEAHRYIMRCLGRLGDRASAMKHYHGLVDLLLDELGADPDAMTTRLFEQLASESPVVE